MKTMFKSIALALVAHCVGVLPDAHAAAFMKLGDIKGETTDNEHKDWIIIESLSHGIDSKKDPATGLPTGKRQHKPFSITKSIDKATPLLVQAVTSGNPIPSARLEFVRAGEQDQYYQVFLKNVLVTSYKTRGNPGEVPTESFSLNYEEIKWTYTVWDDTDIVHVDRSFRWNLVHEAGVADKLPAGSFRLGHGRGGNALMLEWEGFEEFHYVIKTSQTARGVYTPVQTYDPLEDGKQELELPVGAGNMFIQIEKVRESLLQQ